MGITLGHKSYVSHSGYGYSKRRCEDITSWFITTFYPRHKLEVDIIHKGLKREGALGYCDWIGETRQPREFDIEHDYGKLHNALVDLELNLKVWNKLKWNVEV